MATLVIGIGTTGMHVLEEAQQFNYEFMNQNTPEGVEYIFIDTDSGSQPRNTPLGYTAIKKIHISLKDIDTSVAQLRENPNFDSEWFPPKLNITAERGAAGGRPTYGRLALWAYLNNIKTRIQNFAQMEGDKRVLVVGSLTGGTGSGICVDLAYLIREIIPKVDLQAVFMVPSAQKFSQKDRLLYENAYSALRSIEYYSVTNNKYQMRTPNDVALDNPKPPYDLVSIISEDYDQKNSAVQAIKMKDLTHLIKSAGLYVSSLFLPGDKNGEEGKDDLKSAIDMRRKDAQEGRNQMKCFSSFGIALAQYPKNILEEYLALDYSEDIINYWLNEEVRSNKIENQAKIDIEKHVYEALNDELNVTVNNKPLNNYISFVTEQIITKRYGEEPDLDSYLDALLSTEGTIYEIVKKNIDFAKNYIIRNINEYLINLLEVPQLKAAENYLNATAGYLVPQDNNAKSKSNLLAFWENYYGVNGEANRWPTIYTKLKQKLKKELRPAKLFMQEKSLLEERLNDIVQLLKMNLIYGELEKIGIALSDSKRPIYADGQKLIDQNDITNLSNQLKNLLNPQETSSFTARKTHIDNNKHSFAQVYYYYNQGDFDSEKGNLEQRIKSGQGIDTTGKTLLNGQSLYKFITENNSNSGSKEALYYKILPAMVNQVSNAIGGSYNINIYELIQKKQNEHPVVAKYLSADYDDLKNSPPPLMHHSGEKDVHGEFQPSILPLLYASNSIAETESLANQIRKNKNLQEKAISNQQNNAFSIPSLNNALLFFREYAFYGTFGTSKVEDSTLIPTRDIQSLAVVKDYIKTNISDYEFILNHLPYFNQLKQNNNFDIEAEFNKEASHHDTSE